MKPERNEENITKLITEKKEENIKLTTQKKHKVERKGRKLIKKMETEKEKENGTILQQ